MAARQRVGVSAWREWQLAAPGSGQQAVAREVTPQVLESRGFSVPRECAAWEPQDEVFSISSAGNMQAGCWAAL
jgi:hypothetical protein